MDGKDFSIRLKKIKAEVLAMKQAHDYGLGRTDLVRIWWNYEYEPAVSGELTITIVFTDKITEIPYFQIFGASDIDSVSFSNHTMTIKKTLDSINVIDWLFTVAAPIVSSNWEIN